ncbi:formate hydrogenlyase subunit 3/multisubunit Na+/H+ antiporter, MnhD subunit [Candidatus Methanoperedens nitroreducens]|uniref:Formate hydrogenlyase subunit 3/multisubunit Na+/H+ antiporter, MnhD subunit n=1 Tax=Candidatus Methanoperedens nitratireducens TaxID=1392998 RepID=A0A062V8I3_9EURY|nr:Na(+)/H(+) antiporter subunit D [Candidatus Methanoperedens nitroreducens]KCZ71685.1 formate hydrogenlyase subunit 3/multisubunit Na+/H+ antiporter, MnhD subunit [Candidatus Methanoperedens nitroreducens]MDJ1421313.1 Na(+)/H(+) antiporter subunit D [Candidatus Methanoperedens sp.]
MIEWVPPAAIMIVGAFLIPLLKGKVKQAYLLLLPLIVFINLLYMGEGTGWVIPFMEYSLIFGQVDKLSMAFGYVFVIMAFIGILYALHIRESGQHFAAFMYVGSALGVVFAGDFFSLFVFWEIMAFSSVFLIWYNKEKASRDAGLRYLLVHVAGGLSLLAGIIIRLVNTGSIEFGPIDFGSLDSYLILLGFMLNAAVPPLHAWLSDAYPEATVTGAVFLSAFTTKTAVYVLLRAFLGVEILIWLGAFMAVFGVVYALLQNDIRRLLAYEIISQVGYMVAGVGMGTILAVNGSTAHAFTHILYKGLLFMCAGAVIHMAGKRKLTELGGLYKTMPITLGLYMIGALSISALPFFSGFVSKSMVVSAAAHEHLAVVWLLLTLASAGTFLIAALRLPYFVFFARDAGIKAKEPPVNMLLAMGLAAFLNILIGVYPAILYGILPYPVDYVPYTGEHIVWALQILLFTALGFFLLLGKLGGEHAISLDTDWFYRKGSRSFMWFVEKPLSAASQWPVDILMRLKDYLIWLGKNPTQAIFLYAGTIVFKILGRFPGMPPHASERILEEGWSNYPGEPVRKSPVGDSVILVLIFMTAYAIYYYFVS